MIFFPMKVNQLAGGERERGRAREPHAPALYAAAGLAE